MLFQDFNQIDDFLKEHKTVKTIALAGSHDDDALSSLVAARRAGLVRGILIGDVAKTKGLLSQLEENIADYEFVEQAIGGEAAMAACKLVSDGQADIPMKGQMQTAEFLRAIFTKEYGFVEEKSLLAQATIFEHPNENRLLVLSDCAVNIAPTLEEKIKITNGAVELAHKLGIDEPKVAVLAPMEMVNPKIPSTIDAACIAKAGERGVFGKCVVDGPLALDNALSEDAARHKGIVSRVAGNADILIMPDLNAGNIFTKSLAFILKAACAGTVTGTLRPIVMTSRADSAKSKYVSILSAILQSA